MNLQIVPMAADDGDEPVQLDKRTYLPFVLRSTCPQCGVIVAKDLCDEYLSYPIVGEPETVYFYHSTNAGTHHEWPERVIVRITLEAAS